MDWRVQLVEDRDARMITYDRKHWWKILFRSQGTALPRVIWRVGFFGALTAAIWLWHTHAIPLPRLDPLGHSLLGVALGMLIVLRTNSSYDRWWEGRKLWSSLLNSGRNLVRAATVNAGAVRELADLVHAYAVALKLHLRKDGDLSVLKGRMSAEMYKRVVEASDPPAAVAFFITRWIKQAQADGRIDGGLARQLDGRVNDLIDLQGGCDRIQQTPMPFAYAAHIKQLLMLYLVTLPLLLVQLMGGTAVFVVPAIAFGLLGVEEAGIEIEDPFGTEPNDLPLDELCADLDRDLAEFVEMGEEPADVGGVAA
jgi:putative membrane protein